MAPRLINRFDFDSLKQLYHSEKRVIINHHEMGDGYIHKVDERRDLIFILLEGDIFAFGRKGDKTKEIYELEPFNMSVFVE